jgi:hypothetical protein
MSGGSHETYSLWTACGHREIAETEAPEPWEFLTMKHMHREIVDAVLFGETPEDRLNEAKRIVGFALAALASKDGTDAAAKARREIAETSQ